MELQGQPGRHGQEINRPPLPSTAQRGSALFSTLRRWGGFVKFSHTVFALPFALASMAVAARDQRGWPGARIFLLILAAMTCARTCAMSFNRIADREFDRANPRTAGRHLPRGEISLAGAWTLCLASGAGLIAASYFLNSVLLSFARGAGGGLLLFIDETVHRFHARLFGSGTGAGAGGRVAGGARQF
jgi:4-hydroxybenzoate polyprenyltransferase